MLGVGPLCMELIQQEGSPLSYNQKGKKKLMQIEGFTCCKIEEILETIDHPQPMVESVWGLSPTPSAL